MSIAYFDASVLLAILLGESRAAAAVALWQAHEERVSSILVEAECFINLTRYASARGGKLPRGWLDQRIEALNGNLDELSVQRVDPEILTLIRRESLLAECRTLDAVHLATALLFNERGSGELRVVSFDDRMRRTAAKLKLKVLPA